MTMKSSSATSDDSLGFLLGLAHGIALFILSGLFTVLALPFLIFFLDDAARQMHMNEDLLVWPGTTLFMMMVGLSMGKVMKNIIEIRHKTTRPALVKSFWQVTIVIFCTLTIAANGFLMWMSIASH